MEHTDFDRIAHLLSNGAEIHLGNGERLIELDDQTDEAIVQQGDVERRIPLSELDDRWSASTFELLVSHHDEHIVVVMGLDPAEDGGVSG